MRSMTAFGQASGLVEGRQLVVELRCLNHRFCEVRLQGLNGWAEVEVLAERLLQQWARHGRVECTVRSLGGAGLPAWPVLDGELARAYVQVYGELSRLLGMAQDNPAQWVALLAQAPGVVSLYPGPRDGERARRELLALVEEAAVQADRLRLEEGRRLEQELTQRLGELGRRLGILSELLPGEFELMRRQAAERVRELVGGAPLDPGRLEQELALLAEKCDVREELVRLESHRLQFEGWLRLEDEPVGKKLDFLLQEMGREINTLSAKMRSARVVHEAVAVKAEIEKMREQVQNVW
jgi:uncharacterized protein (TIGR00255 family)